MKTAMMCAGKDNEGEESRQKHRCPLTYAQSGIRLSLVTHTELLVAAQVH